MKKEIEQLYEKLKPIEYGFTDKEHNVYFGDPYIWAVYFDDKFCLQSPEDLEKSKVGICWDQVEYERKLLKDKYIEATSYYITAFTNYQKATHTFMAIKADKYYWLEHAWSTFEGIREYDSLNELLIDVKIEFEKGIGEFVPSDISVYEYKKPKYHLNAQEFMNYCENSKKIDI